MATLVPMAQPLVQPMAPAALPMTAPMGGLPSMAPPAQQILPARQSRSLWSIQSRTRGRTAMDPMTGTLVHERRREPECCVVVRSLSIIA